MNMEDFLEKMDPAHRIYLCRMLKIKDLPQSLLERYAQVKIMVDRIDGFLSPGLLAIIAVIAGLDMGSAIEKAADEPDVKAADEPVEQVVEQVVDEVVDETAKNDEAAGPTEPAAQGQFVGATGQAQEKTAAQPPTKLWSPGMPVTVLVEEELRQGKIVGIHRPEPDSGKAVHLTIDVGDGEMLEADEDEVEAV